MEASRNSIMEDGMGDTVTYVCRICGKEVTVEAGAPVPHCCGREMEPLPYCQTAPNPEMVRSHKEDEPCDDGTRFKGKK